MSDGADARGRVADGGGDAGGEHRRSGSSPSRASGGGPLPSGRRRGALTVGARLRAVTRHRGPRNLRRTAQVVADVTPARGTAARLTGRQLTGPPRRLPAGPFKGRDPLRTGRLWRWWHWLGFGYWATLTGLAGWLAWRRHRPVDADEQDGWGGA